MAGLYDARMGEAKQKADLARLLRNQYSNQPAGQMVSGWYVPNTGNAILGAMANVLGAYQEKQANEEMKGIEKEKLQSTIQALNKAGIEAPEILLKQAGTEEVKPGWIDKASAFLRGQDQPQPTPAQPYQQNVAQNVQPQQRIAGLSNLVAVNPEYASSVLALEKLQADQAKDLRNQQMEKVPVGFLPAGPGEIKPMTIPGYGDFANFQLAQAQKREDYLSPVEKQNMANQQANLILAQNREAREQRKEAEPKPLTESQANANLFGKRMMSSNEILGKITDYSPTKVSAALATENTPLIGMGVNAMLGENEQQVAQAQRDFLNAALRKESGASISANELANGRRQYFPQPGDKPEVLAQKAQNRQTAIQGILEGIPEKQRPRFQQSNDPFAGFTPEQKAQYLKEHPNYRVQ